MSWYVPFLAALAGAIVGGGLAIGGGLYQEHRRFLRRRRVAARVVLEDLIGHLFALHLERLTLAAQEGEGAGPEEPGDLAVDLAVWRAQEQTLAEVRSHESFEVVRKGYRALVDAEGATPARVLRHEQAQGRLDLDIPIGSRRGGFVTREDAIAEAIPAVERAGRAVGRWTGLPAVEVERQITDCAPLPP